MIEFLVNLQMYTFGLCIALFPLISIYIGILQYRHYKQNKDMIDTFFKDSEKGLMESIFVFINFIVCFSLCILFGCIFSSIPFN